MTTLYGNPFLNYALLSLMDIPAHLVSWFSAKYFPRRVSFIVFSLLGALALFVIRPLSFSCSLCEYNCHCVEKYQHNKPFQQGLTHTASMLEVLP